VKRRLLSPDALILVGLLVLLAVLSFRIVGQGVIPENPAQPRRSITSARPGGWKALYLLLKQSGVPVARVERGPAEWPKDVRVMIAGQEYNPFGGSGSNPRGGGKGGGKGGARNLAAGFANEWTEAEARDALEWLEGGDGDDEADGGKVAGKARASSVSRTLILLTGENNALTERLGLDVATKAGRANATLRRRQPLPILANIDSLRVPSQVRWNKLPAGAVPVFADRGPAVVVLRRGKGTVIAVSDPGVAENKRLAEADNARFFLDLARAYGGTVGFDEYHQGFRQSDNFWDAVGRPGQLVVWQLVGLALLVCYSAGRRFGLPRPLPPAPRVSSEYVSSLANLYRRAGAADAALEGVYLSFWRDLCRAVGLPYDAPTDEVIKRAAHTLGAGGNQDALEVRLMNAVHACERKLESARITDKDLLPLARDLEQMRKELGLGGNDDPREPAATAAARR